MRKALVDQLDCLESLTGATSICREYLHLSILGNQASLVTTHEHMQRCISARRLVLAEVTLRLLKRARYDLGFASYLNEVSNGLFLFGVEFLKELKKGTLTNYARNPFGPFWCWLSVHFVAIQSLRYNGPANVEVSVLFNRRYKRLWYAIPGYENRALTKMYVKCPLIRFADLWYTGCYFPCGGLPEGRLVDAELAASVFDSEV